MQWCMIDSDAAPQFITANLSVVRTETYLLYIEQLYMDQFIKMVNMFRVETPQPFFFKNYPQWSITGLDLIPHFKYSTTL